MTSDPYRGYTAQDPSGYPPDFQPHVPYAGYATYPTAYSPPPAAAPAPRRNRRRLAAAGAGVLVAGAVVAVVAVAESGTSTITGLGSAVQLAPSTGSGSTGGSSSGGSSGGTLPGTLPGGTSGRSGTPTSASLATKAQQEGVVTIVSVLKYQNAESAGTGMILTSNGEILTNNHVINGATSITVTVARTGTSYRADVVGTDLGDDVAVLQLRRASRLATANIDSTPDVSVGTAVVGVGNAGGTGTLRASAGKVTALGQTITASDDDGTNSERLTGLIEVDAAIISGDSGGPMYDSAGEIVGMNTAASAGRSATTTAYAIPINDALTIAGEIEKGVRTSSIHIGLPGFIGVATADANGSGASITSVLPGAPADTAGITAGSVITRVGGRSVTSAPGLKTALTGHAPGSSVRLTWTGVDGAPHTATVTLTTGPAD